MAKMADGNEQFLIDRLPLDLQRVAEVLDYKSALKLASKLGGNTLYIAKLDKEFRNERNIAIIKAYGQGKRPKDIALQYNITERQVWTILGKDPSESDNLWLF